MLDRRFIRDNPEQIKQMLADRGLAYDLDAFLAREARRRDLITHVETLQAQRNEASEKISRMKKNKEDAAAEISAMREVGENIKRFSEELKILEEGIEAELLQIPNLPHASVPRGPDAAANREVRTWGQKPVFMFTPCPHWELGEALGMLDAARAAKIAGARFVVYRDVGARLERALIQFMLDTQTQRAGYMEIFPPLLVNRDAMIGTGQLPKLENDMFKTKDDDFYLIPTAEVPVTNLHRQEVLSKEQLPIKYAAYTPCFRREAGSYGKDTKGIVRQHQFNKVELVKITQPDESYKELEALVQDAENILQALQLHYRVVVLSTGDMSFASAKGYDLEVWHAGSARYWEVSSCSNFEAFQARRANIRFKDDDGKIKFCHTLNGSGLATSRLLPAIMENYQTKDGGIQIPEVLVPYLGGKHMITPNGKLG
ncbi:serine--tRNA ligase [candidate division FCPU426 bacterium]|nr:serine--tRNA ligase [candidate division FCPU426 bacterium]